MRAFLDESVLLDADHGTYVVAAAVVDVAQIDDARRAVVLAAGARRRWHWHGEGARERVTIASAIGSLGVQCVAATAPVERTRQERARRTALGLLLPALERRGVTVAVLESRQVRQDRRDIEAVDAFRSQRRLTDRLRIEHARPTDEPLLWLPDAVAGAVVLHHRGDDRFVRLLGGVVRLDGPG